MWSSASLQTASATEPRVKSPTCLDESAAQALLEQEAVVLRQQASIYIRGVVPCIVMYVCIALQPFFDSVRHLRVALLLFSSISFSCVLVKYLVLQSDARTLKRRLESAETFCLAARLLMHIVCIRYESDPSHIFLKLLSLWFLPVSAAKECLSTESFKVYLGCHTALVLVRFWGQWEDGAAWMIGTLVMDRMLLDLSKSRHDLLSMREDLSSAFAEIEKLAEVTTKTLFARFCDACGTLTDDLTFAEPSPLLAAMLGINESNIRGRDFCSMIDAEDVAIFNNHIDTVDWNADSCVHPHSIQVRLLDAFAKHVPVHIFSASFLGIDKKRVHFIGISETWRPARSKKKDSSKRMGLGTSVTGGFSGCLASSDLPETLQSPLAPSGAKPKVPRSEQSRSTSPPVKTLGLEKGKSQASSILRGSSPRPRSPPKPGAAGAAQDALQSVSSGRARSPRAAPEGLRSRHTSLPAEASI